MQRGEEAADHTPKRTAALLRAIRASTVVDLTHVLRPGIPSWPGHPHYCQEVVESYATGSASCHHALSMGEHTGTHLDAPLHFVPPERGGWGIDRALPESFLARMATLDANWLGAGRALAARHMLEWESEHGRLEPGDAVFFRFGWDRFWHGPGGHAAFLRDWPGISRDLAELLVDRRVVLAGCDCLSIDRFGDAEFPAHRTLLGAGIMIGENFNRLGQVPPVCSVAMLPLPVEGGSGAPLRAVALV